MHKSFYSLLASFVAVSFSSLANTAVTLPIQNMFDAMREHDGDKLKAQFTESAQLQRAEKDGMVKTTNLAKFAASVSKTQSYLDEHLLHIEVNQSGNLASVWTPYAFYRNGELSHCGVNSFQIVETNAGWKIHYAIDNVFQGDCQRFIKEHNSL